MSKTKINLGAGNKIKDPEVWVNHDVEKHRSEIDTAHDLNKLPWPWEDEGFTEIVANSVFEHLDIDLVAAVNECWRILKPGGRLHIKLPNAEDVIGCWGDPTHRRPYTLSFTAIFDYKSEKTGNNFYTKRKWKILKKGGAGNKNKDGIWTSVSAQMEKVK